MSAYHSYDGIPSVADKHALTDILREEWGYEYYVRVTLQSQVLENTWLTSLLFTGH